MKNKPVLLESQYIDEMYRHCLDAARQEAMLWLPIDEPIKIETCTCSINTLCWAGCKCGWIAKERASKT